MFVKAAMGKIEASHVHAVSYHPGQDRNIITCRANGGNYFGLTEKHTLIHVVPDVQLQSDINQKRGRIHFSPFFP
jgi:hypothetical protein